MQRNTLVIPAKAGAEDDRRSVPLFFSSAAEGGGTPAFAGVTGRV